MVMMSWPLCMLVRMQLMHSGALQLSQNASTLLHGWCSHLNPGAATIESEALNSVTEMSSDWSFFVFGDCNVDHLL